jgi:hypothetical protein
LRIVGVERFSADRKAQVAIMGVGVTAGNC